MIAVQPDNACRLAVGLFNSRQDFSSLDISTTDIGVVTTVKNTPGRRGSSGWKNRMEFIYNYSILW